MVVHIRPSTLAMRSIVAASRQHRFGGPAQPPPSHQSSTAAPGPNRFGSPEPQPPSRSPLAELSSCRSVQQPLVCHHDSQSEELSTRYPSLGGSAQHLPCRNQSESVTAQSPTVVVYSTFQSMGLRLLCHWRMPGWTNHLSTSSWRTSVSRHHCRCSTDTNPTPSTRLRTQMSRRWCRTV